MTRDERATEQLLGSWYDWVPGPRTSTGLIVARGALPGEVASAERHCPVCGGDGRRRVRGIDQSCVRCGGGGAITVDAYTGRELAAKADLSLVASIEAELALEREDAAPETGTAGQARAARKAQQDATLLRLKERALDEGPGDVLTSAWDARIRQYEAGDYAPLEALMALWRQRAKQGHDALLVVFVLESIEPGLRKIGPRLRARAEVELHHFAPSLRAELGRPIRIPPWIRAREERERESLHRGRTYRHVQARRQRNGVIVAMANDGRSAEQIAERTGLSARRVRQVVASSSVAYERGEATGTFAL